MDLPCSQLSVQNKVELPSTTYSVCAWNPPVCPVVDLLKLPVRFQFGLYRHNMSTCQGVRRNLDIYLDRPAGTNLILLPRSRQIRIYRGHNLAKEKS
uniref:Uncharacterized protein n=1 Tax=Setaria italica TaxID=4555 RepID=K3ZYF4_SETIT